MDRNTQDTFLLSELGELAPVETSSTDVVPQNSGKMQKVYTQLPAVLEDARYQHIYVTVDTPQDIATLARSLNSQEVNVNQSNIVTLAVPAVSQLLSQASTFIIQPGGVAVSTGTTPAARIVAKEQVSQVILKTESGRTTTTKGKPQATVCSSQGSTSRLTESDKALATVSNAKTNERQEGVVDVDKSVPTALSPEKELANLISRDQASNQQSANIPLVVCRCDTRKDNVKTAQQIFTNVQANLASQLMEKIPGCTSTFLHQFTTQHDMTLRQPDKQANMQVSGDLHKVLCLYDNLSQLLSATDHKPAGTEPLTNPADPAAVKKEVLDTSVTKDKAVHCDLLQPEYSRSGRQIKRKNLDFLDKDDSVDSHPLNTAPRKTVVGKRKRGRPPKYPKHPEEEQPEELQKGLMTIAIKAENIDADTPKKAAFPNSVGESSVLTTDAETRVVESVLLTASDHTLPFADNIIIEHTVSPEEITADCVSGGVITDIKGDSCTEVPSYGDEDIPDANSLSEKENSQEESSLVEKQLIQNPKDESEYTALKTNREPPGIVLGRKKPKKDYEALAPFKFHCSMCSFKSKRKSHYLKHLLIHTKKSLPVLQCKQCSFTTIRLSHLRRHQMTHSTNVFTCNICSYKTDDMKRLSRHQRIKHLAPEPEPEINVIYQCDICDYKTMKSHQFARHHRCHSSLCTDDAGQTSSSYQCPLCPYKTQRKEHYSRHVANVHTDRRPYLCDLCGKAFKRPDALRQHKLVHQDKMSRPLRYTCQDCLKGFRSHAHLVEHQTIHTDERSYLCEICGAAFKTRSVQRKHVQTIHQNPRAHSCSSCDKRFNTKYALQRHLRTHNTPGMRSLSITMEQLGSNTTVAILPTTTDSGQIIQGLQETPEVQAGEEGHTIVTGEVANDTAEQQYGESADESVQQLPQTAYIQTTNEETTALLYLSNLPTY